VYVSIYTFNLFIQLCARKDRLPGGQTALNALEELMMIRSIMTCADWGFPFTLMDVRLVSASAGVVYYKV